MQETAGGFEFRRLIQYANRNDKEVRSGKIQRCSKDGQEDGDQYISDEKEGYDPGNSEGRK